MGEVIEGPWRLEDRVTELERMLNGQTSHPAWWILEILERLEAMHDMEMELRLLRIEVALLKKDSPT